MTGDEVAVAGSAYFTKQVRPLGVPDTLLGIKAVSVAEVAGLFAVAAEDTGIITKSAVDRPAAVAKPASALG